MHVYNVKNKLRCGFMGGKTVLQQFMHDVEDNKYECWFQNDHSTNELIDMVFLHTNLRELKSFLMYS